MSSILFSRIVASVFKREEIQEVSLNSQGEKTSWIFDFKGEAFSDIFLKEYAKSFWHIFEKKYGSRLQVGGMESGAMPLIAGISLLAPSAVKVQPFYVRKSRKKSDLARLVEGEVEKGIPIVIVDDILNSSSTFLKQVTILEDLGYKVSAVFVCIRFRDISFYKELSDKGIEIISIFELNDFKDALGVHNMVTRGGQKLMRKFSPVYRVKLTSKPNLYIVVPKSSPILVGEHIYVGVDDGSFFCIKESDGEVLWKYVIPFGAQGKRIFSSPSVYKDKVFFGAYDGNIYALNRFTGKREWVFIEADWVGSSPCVDTENGRLYIGLEFGLLKKRGGVVCLDANTGEVLWRNYEMEGLTHASPGYNEKNKMVICGCNDSYVYAFNASDGKIVWKFKTEGDLKYGVTFDDKRNLAIIASLDGGVYALNIKDGSLYARFEGLFGFYSTPVLAGDSIIIGGLDKNVYSFSLATKKMLWKFETAGRIFASPALSLDARSLFIGSNDGRLYELSVGDGQLLSRTIFSERIVNKVQLIKSRGGDKTEIILLTHVGELYKLREEEVPQVNNAELGK
jgi:outer membrane protein assembly factor BamB/orotate phosphoribosyltransferase